MVYLPVCKLRTGLPSSRGEKTKNPPLRGDTHFTIIRFYPVKRMHCHRFSLPLWYKKKEAEEIKYFKFHLTEDANVRISSNWNLLLKNVFPFFFRFPVPGDCGRLITCVDGNPRLLTCGDGKLFDSASLSCLDPEELPHWYVTSFPHTFNLLISLSSSISFIHFLLSSVKVRRNVASFVSVPMIFKLRRNPSACQAFQNLQIFAR